MNLEQPSDNKRICLNCGVENREIANYCKNCGKPFESKPKEESKEEGYSINDQLEHTGFAWAAVLALHSKDKNGSLREIDFEKVDYGVDLDPSDKKLRVVIKVPGIKEPFTVRIDDEKFLFELSRHIQRDNVREDYFDKFTDIAKTIAENTK